MAPESNLNESREQEEDNGDDRNSKACSVHAACSVKRWERSDGGFIGVAITKWGVDEAIAAVSTSSGLVSDEDETTDECKVEDDGNESEETKTSEAADEENSGDGVQDCSTRDTLNCLPVV